MKNFSRIFFYLKDSKGYIALYFLFNVLAIVFSLFSLAMLAPFLQLLFGMEKLVEAKPAVGFSAAAILANLNF
jgi:subfamily B ATP-binding cassette protein MsbA